MRMVIEHIVIGINMDCCDIILTRKLLIIYRTLIKLVDFSKDCVDSVMVKMVAA